MFESAGHLYVYLSYGIHYCCNIVCGPQGFGAGVLIRAVEPLSGLALIESHRKTTGVNATNGPGKVSQALAINLGLDGHDLAKPPLRLIQRPTLADNQIHTSKRIGISKAVRELRRFYIANNPYMSRK